MASPYRKVSLVFARVIFAAAISTLLACAGAPVVEEEKTSDPATHLMVLPKPMWLAPEIVAEPLMPVVRSAMDQTLGEAGTLEAEQSGIVAVQADLTLQMALTLGRCRILEAEPDWESEATTAEACRTENLQTFEARAQQVLRIPAGTYEIEVSNPGVERNLGFWLRPSDEPEVTLATGGGIGPGESDIFEVQLTPGEYLYSCPVSPTPDYLLIVEAAHP